MFTTTNFCKPQTVHYAMFSLMTNRPFPEELSETYKRLLRISDPHWRAVRNTELTGGDLTSHRLQPFS